MMKGRHKPFAPRGSFLTETPRDPRQCTCRRLRRGWQRAPRCPVHGDARTALDAALDTVHGEGAAPHLKD